MPSIIYTRVSSDQQKNNGTSLAEQAKTNKDYADKNGLNVTQTISETCSGITNDGMMHFNFKKYNNLLIADVSRFGRNVILGMKNIHKLLKNKVTIHFTRDNIIISPTDLTKLNEFYLLLKLAEKERAIISTRIKALKSFRASRGEHSGGLVPFGLDTYFANYIDESGITREVKRYRIHPNNIKIIQFIDQCKTPPFNSFMLTKLMRNISKFKDPIQLYDDNNGSYTLRETNYQCLSNLDISNLLNDYSVYYKNKMHFTPSIIKRQHSELKLLSLIIEEPENMYFNQRPCILTNNAISNISFNLERMELSDMVDGQLLNNSSYNNL